MPSPFLRIGRFFRELKRRRVYQVTAVYLVLAVGGLEVLDLLIPVTRLPDWGPPVFLGLAVVGLPLVIVFAWTFDITPSGVVRTSDDGSPVSGDGPGLPAPVRDGTSSRETESADELGEVAGETPLSSLDPLAVAVLPFANLSGTPAAEPFANGLHDDLLTELSRASALTVISRTSVQGYRGTEKGMREIGRELGAGTIVEGAVQMAGDRIRLNIQLIDARTDKHRWAERYDRELTAGNIFELQAELATRIMAALEARLTPTERTRAHEPATRDLEAYRLYALGREQYVHRSEEHFRQAAAYFEMALQRDPEFAPAWAGLGMALVGLVDYGHVAAEESLERGIAACRKAVELDPELAEAHAAVGVAETYLRNGPAGRKALARARELGPGLALGYQWSAWLDLLTGRPETALEAALRATRLDPLDPEARGNLALAILATGDPEQAVQEARRALEPHPDFSYALWVLGMALDHAGRPGEGRERWREMGDRQFHPWGQLATLLDRVEEGDPESARKALPALEEVGGGFKAGMLHAALGDVDRAVEAVRRAHPLFWDDALALRYFRWAPGRILREDRRYRDLVRELDESWGGGE